MGDSAGQHPDRFHFLGLPELLFQLFAPRAILRDYQNGVFSVVAGSMHVQLGVYYRSVLQAETRVAKIRDFMRMLRNQLFEAAPIVNSKIGEAQRKKVLSRVAVFLNGGAVDLQELQCGAVDDPHRLRIVRKQQL